MKTESTVVCPQCGAAKIESMPLDFCQVMYDCEACGAILRPKTGDCCIYCIYCTYGDVPCPPKQGEAMH
jgi:hypothetical protein